MDKTNNQSDAGVTQADRDAAADMMFASPETEQEIIASVGIKSGMMDENHIVRAFARHRQQAIAQHEGDEKPVAWQWRYCPLGSGTDNWSDWQDGRKPDFKGDTYEAEERPLYAHPPATRPTALVEDSESIRADCPNCNYDFGVTVPRITQQAEEVALLVRAGDAMCDLIRRRFSGAPTDSLLLQWVAARAALNEQPGGEG